MNKGRAAYDNRELFSNHFLAHRVRAMPEWGDPAADEIFEEMRRLWEAQAMTVEKERQVENRWLQPVLKLLGHHYSVAVSLETPDGTCELDYLLARDAEAAAGLVGVLDESRTRRELAVLEAKRWDRNLDKHGDEATPISAMPAAQTEYYMRHSGVDWGILTNGRLWRLFHRSSAHRLNQFYEIDLPRLLDGGTVDDFRYFFHFFKRGAFGGRDSFLDRALLGSRAYARAIGDELETQVYDALLELARGFFSVASNGLEPTGQTLGEVHDNGLILLYRLLFILFAESRGLLPMAGNEKYRSGYSLRAIAERVVDRGGFDFGIPDDTSLWASVRSLFRFIDSGHAELDVPAFNGGLFNPGKHPFIEENAVGDQHLARAILLLATTRSGEGRTEWIDYRDLSVRHLGSVYEGLLEYRLRRKTAAEGTDELVLETDRGERRATGSYYTPDRIVRYIVSGALDPLLADVLSGARRDDGTLDRAAVGDAVLSLDVLDPAMGSGHFLVEVTDHLAQFLAAHGPRLEHETDPVGHWRRAVVVACIYGVDLNPLAVELARLSLWLRTVSTDKPLSFLDHHLRCGNSLIGLGRDDLRVAVGPVKPRRVKAGQTTLLDTDAFRASMDRARGLIEQIEALDGSELAQVERAAELYREVVDEHTAGPRLAADILLARQFGLDVGDELLRELIPRLDDGSWRGVPQFEAVVEEGRRLARRRRFFHWELEFPEVFRADSSSGGFDAVVGNPPYANAIEESVSLDDESLEYLRARFASTSGAFDLFIPFLELSSLLASPGAPSELIVPNKVLTAAYGEGLRRFWLRNTRIERLGDWSRANVFGTAAVYPITVRTVRPGTGAPELQTADTDSGVRKGRRATVIERFDAMDAEPERWFFERDELETIAETSWAFLLDRAGAELVRQASGASLSRLVDVVEEVVASASTGEAYDFKPLVVEAGEVGERPVFKLLSSGAIDPFRTFHGLETIAYLGERYERPYLLDAEPLSDTRRAHYSSPKVLVANMTRELEAVVTEEPAAGVVNVIQVITSDLDECHYYCALLNSTLVRRFHRLANATNALANDYISITRDQIGQLPVVPAGRARQLHPTGWGTDAFECIAGLSRRRAELESKILRLQRANDPFKFVSRAHPMVPLRRAFDEAYAFASVESEVDRVRHDIEELRLRRSRDGWLLEVDLKHRLPGADGRWAEFARRDGTFVRSSVIALRFPSIDEELARFYAEMLPFRSAFDDAGGLPGGRTRTTLEKILATHVPKPDIEAERLEPLWRVADELRGIRASCDEVATELERSIDELYRAATKK